MVVSNVLKHLPLPQSADRLPRIPRQKHRWHSTVLRDDHERRSTKIDANRPFFVDLRRFRSQSVTSVRRSWFQFVTLVRPCPRAARAPALRSEAAGCRASASASPHGTRPPARETTPERRRETAASGRRTPGRTTNPWAREDRARWRKAARNRRRADRTTSARSGATRTRAARPFLPRCARLPTSDRRQGKLHAGSAAHRPAVISGSWRVPRKGDRRRSTKIDRFPSILVDSGRRQEGIHRGDAEHTEEGTFRTASFSERTAQDSPRRRGVHGGVQGPERTAHSAQRTATNSPRRRRVHGGVQGPERTAHGAQRTATNSPRRRRVRGGNVFVL